MAYVKDFKWKKEIKLIDFVDQLGGVGYQSVELYKAKELLVKIKKNNAKTFLTFTSNMVTSGLRGFFAQIIKLRMASAIVTTIGAIEEDIMKAHNEKFSIGSFEADDVELHEQGVNRIGNIHINNESYMKFEDIINSLLQKAYEKQKTWTPSELFKEIGASLNDENSILYQAHKTDVPIFCPAITDGAFGFHLYLFQQKHKDFIVDVVKDFGNILFTTTHDDKKAVVALGGSISKHHAILSTLLNGGAEYALFMTTAHKTDGSLSGANTSEAKSWGKVKDDGDAVTVIGDATILFPLAMTAALEELSEDGILSEEKNQESNKQVGDDD